MVVDVGDAGGRLQGGGWLWTQQTRGAYTRWWVGVDVANTGGVCEVVGGCRRGKRGGRIQGGRWLTMWQTQGAYVRWLVVDDMAATDGGHRRRCGRRRRRGGC